MKKKILITWWTGYIGSHAVVAFEEAGYETVILDNLSNSSDETLENIWNILWYIPEFYKCDLRNIDEIKNIFEEHVFDWVIHFAGAKSPLESQEIPLYYFQNNITGSINLFEIMERFQVKNIVFSSSANTYHFNNIPPIKELDLQGTTNPYGTTKLLLEKVLEDLSKFSEFNVINLRYFNPIWAHRSGFIWELPDWKPNNLFPYIFKVLTWELDILNVYGWDYETIDGTWVRDYIDVNDLVHAHLLAYNKIDSIDSNWYCNVFNVWTGKWISVLEAIKSVELWTNKLLNYQIVERRKWDIPVSFCDTTKIQNELWFNAKISLEESVLNTWKFYNK